jgi:hypothetical protein
MVFMDNVASMKSIQRNWQGFLSTRIFVCEKKSQIGEDKLPNKIARALSYKIKRFGGRAKPTWKKWT